MKEITCKECGKISIPTYTERPLVVPNLKEPLRFQKDYIPEICDECMSKGWTDDPEEVRRDILNDPLLGNKVFHKIDLL